MARSIPGTKTLVGVFEIVSWRVSTRRGGRCSVRAVKLTFDHILRGGNNQSRRQCLPPFVFVNSCKKKHLCVPVCFTISEHWLLYYTEYLVSSTEVSLFHICSSNTCCHIFIFWPSECHFRTNSTKPCCRLTKKAAFNRCNCILACP